MVGEDNDEDEEEVEEGRMMMMMLMMMMGRRRKRRRRRSQRSGSSGSEATTGDDDSDHDDGASDRLSAFTFRDTEPSTPHELPRAGGEADGLSEEFRSVSEPPDLRQGFFIAAKPHFVVGDSLGNQTSQIPSTRRAL